MSLQPFRSTPRRASSRPSTWAQPGRLRRECLGQASGIGRRAGVSAGHRAGRPDPLAPGELDRVDEALSGPAQAVRPAAQVRGHAHGGACPETGGRGRCRACLGQVPRTAARHSLGSEGSDCLSRLSHHLGRTAVRDRVLNQKATVAARLEEAGAVLVAKLSMGALAMGDQWFGGKTRSPWDPRPGRAGHRPARPRPSRRDWSASPSAARRWAASSPPAAPAGHRACVPPSGG